MLINVSDVDSPRLLTMHHSWMLVVYALQWTPILKRQGLINLLFLDPDGIKPPEETKAKINKCFGLTEAFLKHTLQLLSPCPYSVDCYLN